MSKSQDLTRRTILAGLPAVAGAGVLALPTIAHAEDVSGVTPLIEAFRNAEAEWKKTLSPMEEAEHAYEPAPHYLEIAPGRFIEIKGDRFHPDRTREDAVKRVAGQFRSIRDSLPQSLSDDLRASILRDLNRQQRAAYRRLSKVLADIEKEREAAGVTAAADAYHSTYAAQAQAFSDICSYRCRNMAEISERATFLADEYDCELLGDDFDAFLDSMKAGAA